MRLGQGSAVALVWVGLLAIGACGDSSSTSGSGGRGSTCSDDPCKLVAPQCGCGESQRCSVDGQGARYCTGVGTAKAGEACDASTQNCAAGSVCVGLATDVHVYAAFCTTDADCVAGICSRHLSDGKGGTIAAVNLCTDACNPIGSSSCAQGTACALLREPDGAMRWYAQCAIAQGTAQEGEACASAPCASGLVCAATATESTCHRLCEVKSAAGCVAPAKCVAFDTPVTVGIAEYGACK